MAATERRKETTELTSPTFLPSSLSPPSTSRRGRADVRPVLEGSQHQLNTRRYATPKPPLALVGAARRLSSLRAQADRPDLPPCAPSPRSPSPPRRPAPPHTLRQTARDPSQPCARRVPDRERVGEPEADLEEPCVADGQLPLSSSFSPFPAASPQLEYRVVAQIPKSFICTHTNPC